jgi:hypothetical protein
MISTATATETWHVRLRNGRTFYEVLPAGLDVHEAVALVKQRWPELAGWHLDLTLLRAPL